MKNYIAPCIDIHPSDANILSDSTNTLPVIGGEGLPQIEDGEEILSPKFNLWEDEEVEQ